MRRRYLPPADRSDTQPVSPSDHRPGPVADLLVVVAFVAAVPAALLAVTAPLVAVSALVAVTLVAGVCCRTLLPGGDERAAATPGTDGR